MPKVKNSSKLDMDLLPSNIQRIARAPNSHTFECNVCNSAESSILATNRELLMFCNWHYSRSPECFEQQPPPIPLDMRKKKRKVVVEEEAPVQESLVGTMMYVPAGITVISNKPGKASYVMKRGGDKKIYMAEDDWIRWKSGAYWIQARRIDVF